MTDRANRVAVVVLGLVLLVGGGLAACDGFGVFGASRAHDAVFDTTVVRWWHDGGWESFAVVVAIGVVAVVVGGWLVLSQLRPRGSRHRTPDFSFEAARGCTTVRSTAVRQGIEGDLQMIDDVSGARVDLYGHYPDLQLQAVLDVGDEVDLQRLPADIDRAIERIECTTGVRPAPVRVTLRFRDAGRHVV